MTTAELLSYLRELDVRVWVDGDALKYGAPPGRLSTSLRQQLVSRKQEIIAFLREAECAVGGGDPIVPVPRDGPLPTSFSQQRMWFLHQLVPDGGIYNLADGLRLRGRLNVTALQQSLDEMQRRHEVLRTVFNVQDGDPVQEIQPPAPVPLPMVDLTALDADAREERVRQLATECYRRPFDLATGPVWRVKLMQLDEEEWVLLLAWHHIVTDGVSGGIFFRELSALYDAYSSGQASPLPELPIQYADFAAWQRSRLQGPSLESSLSYWREQLRGPLPVLQLPTDRPRPPTPSFHGRTEAFRVPKALADDVDALSKRLGATLFMTLLAAFKVLLHRYTQDEDIIIGSPVTGRDSSQVQNLVGFFVNTLVLRTDLAGRPTFADLVARVKEATLGAYAHPDVPVEKLVQEVDVDRQLNINPLFQVMFALQLPVDESPRFQGFSVTSVPFDSEVAKFDLSWSMQPHHQGLLIVVEYNTDLFDASTIARMTEAYMVLLEHAVAHPETRIGALPLLHQEAAQQLIREQQETTRSEYPRDASLASLFEEQVAQRPNGVAIVCGGREVTYDALNRRANQLAHWLQAEGVAADVLVGLCLQRDVDMVVAMLGILKAGGAYVPLDPDYPTARLAEMLRQTRIPVLLTEEGLRQRLPEYSGRVLCLDSEWERVASESQSNPPCPATAESLAYVMFTSGSTGQPNGVCIPQRGVVRLVCNTNYCDFGPAERIAQAASASFDAATLEIWSALLNGARTVIITKEVALSPSDFVAELWEQHITTVFLTTALFNQLARQVPGAFRHMRCVMFGGEAVDPKWVRRVLRDDAPERLLHVYGPTESTTYASWYEVNDVPEDVVTVPIGRAVSNTQLYVLDDGMNPTPPNVPGELYIGGDGLARGYLDNAALTAERFVADPFSESTESRLYKTGDMVRRRGDGEIEFLGRRDHQVKVRGFRIELAEIETVLAEAPGVQDAVVVVREDVRDDKRLVAYVVADGEVTAETYRVLLRERLPEYMIPSAFVPLPEIPVNRNGKVDRAALPIPGKGRQSIAPAILPRNETEERVASVWREVLRVDEIGIRDNFFDAGGHSLLLVRVHDRLVEELQCDLPVISLFQYPTIESIARIIDGNGTERALAAARRPRQVVDSAHREAIAIVGMAGRFPGAVDLEAFWSNLREGVESVRFFTDEELREAGVPETLWRDERYVRARAVLEGTELFDAEFFDYSPREAELIDPQQRLFLECSWEALERAGYDPSRFEGAIGVFGGAVQSGYLANLQSHPDLIAMASLQVLLGSGGDFLPTRVSYKLNLRGPSVNVQTACSTSLVAIHAACQHLQNHECDIALAGGVSVSVPSTAGYVYQEGGILSPDGHCRAFDANARGTVNGNGVGVVVLKRVKDAVADGDRIHAVIRGTAINNDGAAKVGYTAPSVEGQAEVIAMAQAAAAVEPHSIGYIETHGTGTSLGDPIEVEALHQVFAEDDRPSGSCLLGSLKSNMGHLDAAAGVASVIKTVLCLEHRELVPSLHFEAPNPEIDFTRGPLGIVTERQPWHAVDGRPRRAGVSSFGIGGTNAHAVLEEAPARCTPGPSRPWQVLPLAAKTPTALEAATVRLARHLKANGDVDLADVAYTLSIGRRHFGCRRIVVCEDIESAIVALEGRAANRTWSSRAPDRTPGVVFMFPGQGSQYVGMGRDLYQREVVFRRTVDACADRLQTEYGIELRDILYGGHENEEAATERLRPTLTTQLALFTVELALARLWTSWGIKPDACIGHSIGEYVAACVSGVLSLEDALRLVVVRGRAMAEAPSGAMLGVPLAVEAVEPYLTTDGVWLSAVNSPKSCVVSGEPSRIDELEERLRADGLEGRRLHTAGAFHSGLMAGVVGPLRAAAEPLQRNAPEIPYISNVTGSWMTPELAQDPEYWSRHAREPVLFAQGVEELLRFGAGVFLELGPGQTLATLVRQRIGDSGGALAFTCLRSPKERMGDRQYLARCLGQLWCTGVEPDWNAYFDDERRLRVGLPTYPFERKRYWIERNLEIATSAGRRGKLDLSEWYYVPVWKQSPPAQVGHDDGVSSERRWLAFGGDRGIGRAVVAELAGRGQDVLTVVAGSGFSSDAPDCYSVEPGNASDYGLLMNALAKADRLPTDVVYFWGTSRATNGTSCLSEEGGEFYNLLRLIQAATRAVGVEPMNVSIVTHETQLVTGAETLCAERGAVLGLCQVVPQEHPNVRVVCIDTEAAGQEEDPNVVSRLLNDLIVPPHERLLAYRGVQRWVQRFDTLPLGEESGEHAGVRSGGVYLVTGGLGGVGFALAAWLAEAAQAKLILVGRTELPPPDRWGDWLRSRDPRDPISVKIQRAQAIEALGGEAMVVTADVADADRMREVIAEGEARFGAIHGVVHAAGEVSSATFKPVMDVELEECERQFRPKVAGTKVLAELFKDRSLDFCLLTSSLSTVLGGLGFAPYAAANAFLDTFALDQQQRQGNPWIAVDWDGWLLEPTDASTTDGITKFSMAIDEGKAAFARILSLHDVPRVVVSTGDLDGRLAAWVTPGGDGGDRKGDEPSGSEAVHGRPELGTPYVAPGNECETTIAAAWQEMLGIDRIGIHDNFFELGGDSLVAVQLMFRLTGRLGVTVTVNALFEHPTVAELAAVVSQMTAEQESEADKLSRILEMVEGLSDEEVKRALAEGSVE